MPRLIPPTASFSIACALCTLLTACASPPVQHVPVAVQCPPMPRPPAELMQPLPTLDMIPVEMLPPKLRAR